MEQKFYQDNFEQFLKESTENFRMYPSKRVWHSIYNNLHPGRRWPSLAILLLLISSVIFIGVSNSNKSKLEATSNSTDIAGNSKAPAGSTTEAPSTSLFAQELAANNEPTAFGEEALSQNPPGAVSATASNISSNGSTQPRNSRNNRNSITDNGDRISRSSRSSNTRRTTSNSPSTAVAENRNVNTELDNVFAVEGLESNSNTVTKNTDIAVVNVPGSETIEAVTTEAKKQPEAEKKQAPVAAKKNINSDKEWIEDYAFHNKPTASKWRSRVSYQLYLTPSVGYRVLSKNTNFNPVYTALVSPTNSRQDYKEALSQAAAINIELGGNFLYSLTKNWNLKAGIQFNYTNYAINAYELKHPTTTTILLNDLNNGMTILDPRATDLANATGVSTTKLKNNTYQISIPMGADIRIAGKGDLKWYAGATIQPTYIIGGHSYLISSDLKNYVQDNSFMRTWNLNAAVETFISYKTKGGIIINAGPQFRYQVMSTNSKQYTYDEKLYNLGVKIGITTRF